MKYFQIIFWALLILTTASCNKYNKMIVKEWKMVEVENETAYPETEPYQKAMKDFKENARIIFNEDKTYYFNLAEEDKKTGVWKIKKKGSVLHLTTSEGSESTMNILELSDDTLVMEKLNHDSTLVRLILKPRE